MRIGTPLSPSATRVMLLGSGELGKEVIIALQRLGVEVIAVDRYADAPGHQVAHRAHVVSMTDGAALRKLVEAERPHPPPFLAEQTLFGRERVGAVRAGAGRPHGDDVGRRRGSVKLLDDGSAAIQDRTLVDVALVRDLACVDRRWVAQDDHTAGVRGAAAVAR